VWHVSVTLWSRGQQVDLPGVAEHAAARELRGVGGDTEWWFYSPASRVGHLRVPLTDQEYATIPPGTAYDDAGETGPQRARTNR
jgi:hypothetical protein